MRLIGVAVILAVSLAIAPLAAEPQQGGGSADHRIHGLRYGSGTEPMDSGFCAATT